MTKGWTVYIRRPGSHLSYNTSTDWRANWVSPSLLAHPQPYLLKHNLFQEWRTCTRAVAMGWKGAVSLRDLRDYWKVELRETIVYESQGRKKNPTWIIPMSQAEQHNIPIFNTIYLLFRKGESKLLMGGPCPSRSEWFRTNSVAKEVWKVVM